MIFLRSLTRYVIQDIMLKRYVVIILISVMPVSFVLSVLPITSGSISTWSSLYEFIKLFRYEFCYCPIFIILIGSLYHASDWIMIRRYERREQIPVHKIALALAVAALFTFMVFIFGTIINIFVKAMIYPVFPPYRAIFMYQPKGTVNPPVIFFVIIFYLVTAAIGILYILINEWTNKKIVAAIIVISLIVIDKFTVSLIPIILGSHQCSLKIKTSTLRMKIIEAVHVGS